MNYKSTDMQIPEIQKSKLQKYINANYRIKVHPWLKSLLKIKKKKFTNNLYLKKLIKHELLIFFIEYELLVNMNVKKLLCSHRIQVGFWIYGTSRIRRFTPTKLCWCETPYSGGALDSKPTKILNSPPKNAWIIRPSEGRPQ